jgi:DNA replication and repair protein RecF
VAGTAEKKTPEVAAAVGPDDPELWLNYEGPGVGAAGAEGSVEKLASAIDAALEEETRRGRVLIGPHRDDLKVRLGGWEVGRYGSAGERRRTALVLRLAQARVLMDDRNVTPILLIDDVDSELDEHRVERVIDIACDTGQALVSTNKESLATRFGGRVKLLRLKAGRVGS